MHSLPRFTARLRAVLVLAILGQYCVRAQNLSVGPVSYTNATNPDVQATSTIGTTSTVTVSSGAAVTFRAGTKITLSPGFRASSGAYFHAVLGSVTLTSVYTLTVINGSGGSGGLSAGTVRQITANPTTGTLAFANWTFVTGPGTILNSASSSTSITIGSGDVQVRANYSGGSSQDSDRDGVNDDIEIALGLNPNDPNDVNVFNYTYDKVNQLKTGPGGDYSNKDAEGNIQEVRQ
jgi:hypothetical protein